MMENTFKTLFSLEIHMSDLVMHGIVVPRLSLGQGGWREFSHELLYLSKKRKIQTNVQK